MGIMDIQKGRRVNQVIGDGCCVTKRIVEGERQFLAEQHALQLLGIPVLIDADYPIIRTIMVPGLPLQEVTAKSIVQLADCLNFVHSHKKASCSLLHGDIHKENIILSDRGMVLVDYAESFYGDPLIDAAAVEIHITNDPELLSIFYATFTTARDQKKINLYKMEHCRKHLEWADAEGFYDLASKSRKIIAEVKNAL